MREPRPLIPVMPFAFLFPGPLPQSHDPLSPAPEQRASDADRDTVVDILSAAAAEGRLTLAELDERVGEGLSARTLTQLVSLIADLPGPWPQVPVSAPAPNSPPVLSASPQPAARSVSPAEPASGAWANRAPGRWSLLQSLVAGPPAARDPAASGGALAGETCAGRLGQAVDHQVVGVIDQVEELVLGHRSA